MGCRLQKWMELHYSRTFTLSACPRPLKLQFSQILIQICNTHWRSIHGPTLLCNIFRLEICDWPLTSTRFLSVLRISRSEFHQNDKYGMEASQSIVFLRGWLHVLNDEHKTKKMTSDALVWACQTGYAYNESSISRSATSNIKITHCKPTEQNGEQSAWSVPPSPNV